MSSIDLMGKEVLEDMIGSCLVWLPEWVSEYKKDDAKQVWEYEKAEDFVLGLTVGMIYTHFENWFTTIHRRELNPIERKEIMTVILLNISRIRRALFGSQGEGTETSGTGIG